MASRTLIADLKPKDEIQEVFLVKYLAEMTSRDGKKYLNVILGDSTGDMEARKWNQIDEAVKTLSKGDFCAVKAKVNSFQGRRQLILSDIKKVDENEVNLDDFISKSKFNPNEMYAELKAIVDCGAAQRDKPRRGALRFHRLTIISSPMQIMLVSIEEPP